MSVIYFSDKELNHIYGNLTSILTRADSIVDVSEETLKQFMMRVGLCNRLAYECNYSGDKSSESILNIPKLGALDCSPLSLKKLIERLGLLEYNCIMNSGRCFLDSKDKEFLTELIDMLQRRYIRTLEQSLKR